MKNSNELKPSMRVIVLISSTSPLRQTTATVLQAANGRTMFLSQGMGTNGGKVQLLNKNWVCTGTFHASRVTDFLNVTKLLFVNFSATQSFLPVIKGLPSSWYNKVGSPRIDCISINVYEISVRHCFATFRTALPEHGTNSTRRRFLRPVSKRFILTPAETLMTYCLARKN